MSWPSEKRRPGRSSTKPSSLPRNFRAKIPEASSTGFWTLSARLILSIRARFTNRNLHRTSAPLDSSFENANRRSTHARNQFFPGLFNFHFDLTWPPHFDALLNTQRVAGAEFALLDQKCAKRTRRGAGCRVLVQLPRKHPTRECFSVSVQCKAVSHRRILSDQPPQFRHVHFYLSKRRAISQRHHQVEHTRRNAGRFHRWVEVLSRKTESLGQSIRPHFQRLELRFPLRHRHALRPAVLKTNLHGKHTSAGLLKNMNAAFLRGHHSKFREQKPCADHGMSRKFQFFPRREDAQPCQRIVLCRFLHEHGFRKIHLTRDGLHGVVRQSITIGEHRQRIAFEACGGKNIERIVTVTHGMGGKTGLQRFQLSECL